MSATDIRRLLERARSSDSTSNVKIDKDELQAAWDKAVEAEAGDAPGKPVTEAEAALFRDLVATDLTADAKALLSEIVGQRLPQLVAGRDPAAVPARNDVALLTGVEGRDVALQKSGSLRIDSPTSNDPMVEAAATLVLAQTQSLNNPFALVKDVATLEKVITTHKKLYDQVVNGTRLKSDTPYAQRHARAALMAVARLAAERLVELKGTNAAPALGAQLVPWFKSEPNPALRGFEICRLLESPLLSQSQAVKDAETVVFPAAPPYAEWRKDKVLRVMAYCDNEGGPWSSQVSIFKDDLKMKVKEGSDTDPTKPVVFTKDVRGQGGGFERIEVILAPAPKKEERPSLFEKMGDKNVDIILYSGHAGYGQRVDAALRAGVQTTGLGKLIMLFQCWGAGNIDSIGKAFPEAQVFSTVDKTTAWSDDVVIVRALEGFARGDKWQRLISALDYHAKIPDASGWDKLYFTPATRMVVEGRIDFDKDGTAEKTDPVYLEPTRELLTRAAGSFNPIDQGIPTYALDGCNLADAVKDASLILRYGEFGLNLTLPGAAAPLKLDANSLESGGFFTPKAGDTRIFSFEPVTVRGETHIRVRQNTRFAHAQADELKVMLAFELGRQVATWGGKNADEQVAFGMAFYLQAVYHQANGYRNRYALTSDAMQHTLFLKRYGLPDIGYGALLHSLPGDHPDFTSANLPAFLTQMTTWAKARGAEGAVIGTPVKTHFNEALTSAQQTWDLDPEKVARFAKSLPGHEQDTVIAYSPRGTWGGAPWVLHLKSPDGKRHVVLFDLNRETYRPIAAHDLGDDIDLYHVALEMVESMKATWAPKLWPLKPDADAAAKAAVEANTVALLKLMERDMQTNPSIKAVAEKAAAFVREKGGDPTSLDSIFGYSQEYLRDVYPADDVKALDNYMHTLTAGAPPSP